MRTKFLAIVAAAGCLAAMSASAFAQGASAFPQTLSPDDYSAQASPGKYYGAPASPRLFNQAPAIRNTHRRVGDHTSGER
jgi:hypothetical protein